MGGGFYGWGMYLISLLTMGGLYAVLALGLNIQWGFTGLFNAGIAGFFAIGAYTSAILTTPPSTLHLGGFGLPVPVGLAGSMVAAGLIAWPVGRICLSCAATTWQSPPSASPRSCGWSSRTSCG